MIVVIFILSFLTGMPVQADSYELFKVQGPTFKVEYSSWSTRSNFQDLKPAGGLESTAEVPVRDNALKVLTEKCNICHRRENPQKVFTESNMDGLAPAIYKQVFVKKRMPRGNTVKLTEGDERMLMEWIRTRGIAE